MPNGLNLDIEYGEHKYDDSLHHTSDCHHGCGCSMGPSNSGGPLGLDPFGECPGNPKSGTLLPGDDDYKTVVKRRIKKLKERADQAESMLEQVEPGEVKLVEKLRIANSSLFKLQQIIERAVDILAPSPLKGTPKK